jgi:hypothetical protein
VHGAQALTIVGIPDWRPHMAVALASPETSCDHPFDAATHEVMCLVKRRAYELALVVPHTPHGLAGAVQPCLHIYVKQPCEAGGFVLSLQEVERFYEDLLHMRNYVQHEGHRLGAAQPIA